MAQMDGDVRRDFGVFGVFGGKRYDMGSKTWERWNMEDVE